MSINSPGRGERRWIHAYLIAPPFSEPMPSVLRVIMEREHMRARLEGRLWTGRLVLERLISHILIVSDRHGTELPINEAIANELHRLKATYARTLPVELGGIPRLVRTTSRLTR